MSAPTDHAADHAPADGVAADRAAIGAAVDPATSAGAAARQRARGGERLRRIGTALLVASALGLIVLGFASAQTGDRAVSVNVPGVERVIPQPGDLVLRQSEVGIDLLPGYRGVLIIDGQEIPTFDVNGNDRVAPGTALDRIIDARYDAGLGTVLFTPSKGATVEAFSPGRHTIVAEIWQPAIETREQARRVTWSFGVS